MRGRRAMTALSISAQTPAVSQGRAVSAPSGGAAYDQSLLLAHSLAPVASRPSRPLPGHVYPRGGPYHDNIYSLPNHYHDPLPCPPYTALPVEDKRPATPLRGRSLLHEGLYDLLALIPTPPPFDSSGGGLRILLQTKI